MSKQSNFLGKAFGLALIIMTLLAALCGCKKDGNTTPQMDITPLIGVWKSGDVLYKFTGKTQIPQNLPGLDPMQFEGGNTTHEFNESNPIPLLPELRYREKGEWIIYYAWTEPETGRFQLEGAFEWRDKSLLIGGSESPVGGGGNTTAMSIRYLGNSNPDILEINGTTYKRKWPWYDGKTKTFLLRLFC